MRNAEKAVREAATALQSAIGEAVASGLHVTWPRSADGLGSIAISETKAKPAEVAPAKPATKHAKP